MADNPGRTLLVKARVDLTAFKDSLAQMQRMVASLNKTISVKSGPQADEKSLLKSALESESRKQAAIKETLKVSSTRVPQEALLHTHLLKTLDARQQETIELKKQVALLREKAAAEIAAAKAATESVRLQTTRRLQTMQVGRMPQLTRGVVPTVMNAASTVASTATMTAGTAQSVETAAYQNQMMRQMRIAQEPSTAARSGVATMATPLTSGLLSGMYAGMPPAEAARMQQQRARQLREQEAESRRNGAGGAGGGIEGRLVPTLASGLSGLVGGGVTGKVFSGLLLGGGVVAGIAAIVEGLSSMSEKMKEFIKESGPLEQINNQFEQLSKNAGISGPEFIDKLRVATRGLVTDMELMKAANAGMRSNLHLSEADIIRFTTNVTELARSLGKNVPQAMNMAVRSMATGQPRMVSRYLELNQQELRPQHIAGQTIQQREVSQFQQINLAMEQRRAKTGVAPTTMTETLEKMQVAQKNFWEDFGQGAATSVGARIFMETIDRLINKIGGLGEVSKSMGKAVGDALGLMSAAVTPVVAAFQALGQAISIVSKLVDSFSSVFRGKVETGLSGAAQNANQLLITFEAMHPILNAVVTTFYSLGFALNLVGVGFKSVGTAVDYLTERFKRYDDTEKLFSQLIQVASPEHQVQLQKAMKLYQEGPGKGAPPIKGNAAYYAGTGDLSFVQNTLQNELQRQGGHEGLATKISPVGQFKQQLNDFNQARADFAKSFMSGKTMPLGPPPPKGGPTTLDPADRQRIIQHAEAEVKLTETIEKAKVEIVEGSLAKQRDAQEQQLKSGEVSLAEYVERMKAFAEQEKIAKLAEITAVEDEQLKSYRTILGVGGITQEQFKDKTSETIVNSAKEKLAVVDSTNKQERALQDQMVGDHDAAVRKSIDIELQMRRDAIDKQQQAMKDAYDQQLVDVDTYLKSQQQSVDDTYEAETHAAIRRWETDPKQGEEAFAQLGEAESEAFDKADKAHTANQQASAAERIKGYQREFDSFSGYMQSQQQLQVAQRGGIGLPIAQQRTDTAALIAAQVEEIARLNEVQSGAKAYSTDWYNAANAISTATQNLMQLRQQMMQLNDPTLSVLSSVDSLAQALGGLPQGKRRAFAGIQGIGGYLQTLSASETAQAGGAQGPFTSSVDALGGLFKTLFTSIQGLPDKFDALTKAMVPAINALAGFAAAVQGGPVTGAIAGFGLGRELGGEAGSALTRLSARPSATGVPSGILGRMVSSLLGVKAPQQFPGSNVMKTPSGEQPLAPQEHLQQDLQSSAAGSPTTADMESSAGDIGGAASAMSSGIATGVSHMVGMVSQAAGPIGALAGAAFGAILSGIVNQKQRQAQTYLYTMQLQFSQISSALQAGSIGMNQALTEMVALKNDVQAEMQSSSKKKQSAFQQELLAMNQQILALQAQIAQQMTQLTEGIFSTMLAPMGETSPLGPFISQLQQIVQQYSQFAGAAQNAQQLAQANQWLTQSLQQYAQTQMTAMNQAETGAIQDAIQLNDLYVQRNQLLQQEANTEYSIMTQGILTRQQTGAQSKMEQIAMMQQQDSIELQNLNEQIAAAQFRVNAEKEIFNLATTRVGLEMQLLALQNQSTTLQMAQVAALQQVVMAMQSGNFASMITSGLNVNTNNPGLAAFMNLLAALGINTQTGGVSGKSGNLITQFLQQFNIMSSYGYGGFSIVSGGS